MTDQTAPQSLLAWLESAITSRETALKAVPEGRRWYIDPSDGHVAEPDGVWDDGRDRLPNRHGIWIPLFDPADALRRCAADRKLLISHQPTPGVGYGPDDDDTPGAYGEIAAACSSCGTVNEYAVRFPCHVVRTLAEGYGWTDERPT